MAQTTGPVIQVDLGWIDLPTLERIIDAIHSVADAHFLEKVDARERLENRIAQYEARNNPKYAEMIAGWKDDLVIYTSLVNMWDTRRQAAAALSAAYRL